MKLFYFLTTIFSILTQIHCAVLVPTNQSNIKFFKQTKIENVGNTQETKNKLLSNENSDEAELYLTVKYCKDEEYLHKFISHDNKSQWIVVTWNSTRSGKIAVLSNICSVHNGLPLQRRCYRSLDKFSKWEKYNNQTVLIDCRLSMFCEAEIFQHSVIGNQSETILHKNIWKRTKIGEYSIPQDLCLQPNGLPIARKCLYDVNEQKAKWNYIENDLKDIKCLQNIRQQTISNELNHLHENFLTDLHTKDITKRHQTCTTLLSLLNKPKITLLPADIQLTSNILKDVLADTQDIALTKDVLQITHSVMTSDTAVLRISAELNATNILLETFENYLDGITNNLVSNSNCHTNLKSFATNSVDLPTSSGNDSLSVEVLNLTSIGVYAYIYPNISVFYINPSCALVSGIAIYGSYQSSKKHQQNNQLRYDSQNDLYYRFIFMNESVHDVLREPNLELASFIPIDIWLKLQHTFVTSLLDTPLVAVFKIYAHDSLFVEKNLLYTRKPFSKILSVSLPGFTDELPDPLPFILRHKRPENRLKSNPNTGCGYWNYTTWISTGVFTNYSQSSTADYDLILCTTNHLTQFTYLLGGSYRQNDLSDKILVTAVHQQVLDIISMIGCSLSLLGLLGIWITALLFNSWRSQASNKILLNMCVSLTFQMILFLCVNTSDMAEFLVANHSYTKCVILGALLQYSVLVLFTWMLFVAFLQFQRYVTVIGIKRPQHYILKSALLAWSLPLIPTILLVLLDFKSYIPNNYQLATNSGICYPSGYGLKFGVILPVSLIILINLLIFLHVFYSISHTLSMSLQRYEKQMVYKQIRLSVLLFFLLGLSWIFGLLAFTRAQLLFSYLFCLTATLQGLILFIYFVVLDENARNSWRNILCPSKAMKKSEKKVTELQSITTTTTSFSHDTSSSRVQ